MSRTCNQLRIRFVKYKTLGVLFVLVLVLKLFLTGSDWQLAGYGGSPRDRDSNAVTSCNCLEKQELREKSNKDDIRGIMEEDKAKDGLLDNRTTFTEQFHLKIVSEDPLTKHSWPWGGQSLHQRCKKKRWRQHGALAKTSVVVTFIDKENMATLLRTVHSIFQRTPPHLLEEVILVEDNCLREEFHETLDIYLRAVFGEKVRMIRTSVTLGLIKARLRGIQAGRGDVVVCMDSHVEVQELWLEPLLYEIKTNRRTLATSYLDWIEKTDDVWTYRHGASSWKTYFDMGLVFGFQEISREQIQARQSDPTAAIESPVTVGTIWAMDREFFKEIGEFDEGMELWGGENLDLPIRVWFFNGRVVNVPCSHAAHLESPGYRSYRAHWTDTINKNYKRFLQVWLPEYIQYFSPYFPMFESLNAGDLSGRYLLKQRAHHNMSWYFDNVFPELGIPQLHGLAWGQLMNKGTEKCLRDSGYTVSVGDCGGPAYNFYFFWSKNFQELRFPMHAFNIKTTNKVNTISKEEYMSLYNTGRATQWLHWKNGPLMREQDKLCIEVKPTTFDVVLAPCDFKNLRQSWSFSEYSEDYYEIVKGTSEKYNSLMDSLSNYRQYFSQNPTIS